MSRRWLHRSPVAGIDVTLLIGRLTDSVVTARNIGQCRRHVIGTPAYFAAAGTPRTPADLLGHQAIIYEQRDGSPTRAFRQGTSETSVTLWAVFPTGRQASAKARACASFVEIQMSISGFSASASGRETRIAAG